MGVKLLLDKAKDVGVDSKTLATYEKEFSKVKYYCNRRGGV
jgi:hypothetical protein